MVVKSHITNGVIRLLRYAARRVLLAALTLFFLITIVFFMMRALPGSPFIGDKTPSPQTLANMNAKYGLDRPVIEQYARYLYNCLRGDLGTSLIYDRPVASMIGDAFVVSASLGLRALLFAVIAGLLLGAAAASRRGTLVDTASTLIAIVGVSVPSFILGSLLQYLLALKLSRALGWQLFAVQGWGTIKQSVLPSFALGLGSLAVISRLWRASMLDVLSQDYMKTAAAKGLSRRQMIWRHAARNALLPVITTLGPMTASVLTGTFVIESVFNIPGLGKYFTTSIKDLDYTMIGGTTIFYGALLIACTLAVDLLYGVIDPRAKLEEQA